MERSAAKIHAERRATMIYKGFNDRQRVRTEETARYAQALPGMEDAVKTAIEAVEQGRSYTIIKGIPRRDKKPQ